jgi:prepilin-type N-terminal cleavage/methylation domain-containing protein
MPVAFAPSVGEEDFRRGFTIVELLVVIAIIGVLVSILLPAVNAVRDSAARTQNLNNLKQIGTAVQSYEASYKTFPPLVKYPTTRKDSELLKRATSWAFEILPFLEQQNIYDRIDRTKVVYDSANAIAMATPVPTYANPRRRDAGARSPFVSGSGLGTSLDYAANGGVVVDKQGQPIQLPNDPSGATLDTPYKTYFNPKFSGPFHHDLPVPAAAVKDGLGNTICVGDRWIGPPVVNSGIPWNDLAGMAGESFPTIVRYANRDTSSGSGAGLPFPSGNTDPSIYKFGSVRGSEACFVFLDGHAIWLPYDTDPEVFLRLAAINDGLPVPPLD